MKYVPAFLAAMACFAICDPALNARPPGTPILTSVSTSLPAAVASAFSSKSVRSSKNASTSAAVFEPAPRSTNVAPREKKPLGIAMAPDTTPEI